MLSCGIKLWFITVVLSHQVVTPGPGTYGKGGIPHATYEEAEHQKFGTKGLLENGGDGSRLLPAKVTKQIVNL